MKMVLNLSKSRLAILIVIMAGILALALLTSVHLREYPFTIKRMVVHGPFENKMYGITFQNYENRELTYIKKFSLEDLLYIKEFGDRLMAIIRIKDAAPFAFAKEAFKKYSSDPIKQRSFTYIDYGRFSSSVFRQSDGLEFIKLEGGEFLVRIKQ